MVKTWLDYSELVSKTQERPEYKNSYTIQHPSFWTLIQNLCAIIHRAYNQPVLQRRLTAPIVMGWSALRCRS